MSKPSAFTVPPRRQIFEALEGVEPSYPGPASAFGNPGTSNTDTRGRTAQLAKRSGVPVATLKHYLREGLIAPTKKSGRTMSWYAPSLVSRVKAIKELQQRQFLPLDVIRDALAKEGSAPDELAAAGAI